MKEDRKAEALKSYRAGKPYLRPAAGCPEHEIDNGAAEDEEGYCEACDDASRVWRDENGGSDEPGDYKCTRCGEWKSWHPCDKLIWRGRPNNTCDRPTRRRDPETHSVAREVMVCQWCGEPGPHRVSQCPKRPRHFGGKHVFRGRGNFPGDRRGE